MPHISFKNVNSQDILKFTEKCTLELASIIECPSDWLTFYDTKSIAIIDNKEEPTTCFIKVEWFKRSDQVRDKVAKVIDTTLRELGKEEIIVQFIEISNENYYENMEKF